MPKHRSSTEEEFQNYVQNTLLQGLGVTDAEIAQLATLYPSDLTQGSPYGTGVTDALSPQYKRLASLQGDLIFQAPRRFLLQNRAGKQTAFAFRGFNTYLRIVRPIRALMYT